MKNLFFFAALLFSFSLFSQSNSVGIGTTTPDSSAILELTSPNQGLRLTRVSSPAAILSPVKGLLILAESDNKLHYFNGSAWKELIFEESDPKIFNMSTGVLPIWTGLKLENSAFFQNSLFNRYELSTNLKISGNIEANSLKIPGGSQGDVLRSADNLGNAEWVSPSSLPITENDPKIHSTIAGNVPVWNPGGPFLQDGSITDVNGMVGILNINPQERLDVNGTTKTERFQMTHNAVDGYYLRSDAAGRASWTPVVYDETDPTVSMNNIRRVARQGAGALIDGVIQDDGINVSIGFDQNIPPDDQSRLSVNGRVKSQFLSVSGNNPAANKVLRADNIQGDASWVNISTLETDPRINIVSSSAVPRYNGTALVDGSIYENGTNVHVGPLPFSFDGAVKFDVDGKTKTTAFQMTTGSGTGKVLQSDVSGNASWVDPGTLPLAEVDPQVSSVTTDKVPRWNGSALSDGVIQDDGVNIGVGTSPMGGQKLTVTGKTTTTNLQVTNGAATGLVLQSDASGNGTWVNSNTLVITEADPQVGSTTTNLIPRWDGSSLIDGVIQDDAINVGIGTIPIGGQKLTVNGKTTTATLQMTVGAADNMIMRSDASGNASWAMESDPHVVSNLGNAIPRWTGALLVDGIIRDDGTNVGIGISPFVDQKLTVAGKTTTTNLQMTTGATNGFVLKSDASGNGTWVNPNSIETDPQVGTITPNRLPRWNGTSLNDGVIQDDATNVAVGTAPVTGQKLTVAGKTTTTNLQMTSGAGANLVLQSDASGNGTWVNPNTLSINNLYNTSGTLTNARTVTQGSNAFTVLNNGTQNTVFNLSSTGDFDIQDNGISSLLVSDAGKVGVNTSAPLAMLHVADSSVVFTGGAIIPATPGNPPVSGAGVRMMWYPDKAAFRSGLASSTSWTKNNTGNYSFAAGNKTIASGFASIAIGSLTTASGGSSTAMGSVTTASGDVATAMGDGTTASGIYGTAMGLNTTASGGAATAIGNGTTASGAAAIAMGFNTTAAGNSSTASGNSTTASGSSSTAIGNFVTARAFASLALGQFNDSIAASNVSNWVSTDPVFIIGNGTADNARNNAFMVLKNAKTGINTNAPQAGLHIKGIAASFDAHLRLESAANTDYANIVFDGDLKFRNFSATADYQWRNNANNIRMVLQDDGDLGIGVTNPLTRLHVNGALAVDDLGNVEIIGDNQVVTVGNSSYLRLSSNLSPASSRTIVLSDGLVVGHIVFIECNETGIEGFEILDGAGSNTNTTGTISMGAGDMIQLMWNGTDWLQVSYSNN